MIHITLSNASLLAGNYEQLLSLLPEQRKARVTANKIESDRLRSLAAGLLLLDRFGDARFSENAYGKPYLANGPFFNLSHSGDWAVLAVSSGEIGVDIEKIRPVNLSRMARAALCPEEREEMLRAEDPQARFFELWTRKESYIKLDGRGFSLPMRSFRADGGAKGAPGSPPRCFLTLPAPDGYALSICSQARETPVLDSIDFSVSPWRREAWNPRTA